MASSQKLHVSSAARYFALCALTLQNTALTVSMKFSYRVTARPYSGAMVVLVVEVLKFVICCAITSVQGQAQDVQRALSEAIRVPKLATPSIMYVAQNNLILISIKHLSQTAYVVAAQGKVITSALFSALILGHSFSIRKRVALLVLMIGIILVQLPAELSVDLEHQTKEIRSTVIGLVAITAANVTSGYAGVILEKLFKTSSKSIWYRNVQLAAFSLPCALLTVLSSGDLQAKSEFSVDLILWCFLCFTQCMRWLDNRGSYAICQRSVEVFRSLPFNLHVCDHFYNAGNCPATSRMSRNWISQLINPHVHNMSKIVCINEWLLARLGSGLLCITPRFSYSYRIHCIP